MGKHVADSPPDHDRLGAWVRSRLEAPNHTAGPHRDPFENRRAFAAQAVAPDPGVTDSGMFKCSVIPVLPEGGRDNLRAEYRAMGIDPALVDIIEGLSPDDVRREPGLTWAVNNAGKDEARTTLLEHERRAKARRAREPKRFIVRKAAPGLWAVRDNARAVWQWSAGSFAAAINLLPLAARDHGPWDGVVRVKVRRPEPIELDDYDLEVYS